jgi:hypothetical protein
MAIRMKIRCTMIPQEGLEQEAYASRLRWPQAYTPVRLTTREFLPSRSQVLIQNDDLSKQFQYKIAGEAIRR